MTEDWSTVVRRNTIHTLRERRARRNTYYIALGLMLVEMLAAFALGRLGFPWEHFVCR